MKLIIALSLLAASFSTFAADSLLSRVDLLEKKVEKLEASSNANGWSCQATCYVYDGNTYLSSQVLSEGLTATQSLQNLWAQCESRMHELSGRAWNIDSSSSTPGAYLGTIKTNCLKN